MQGYKDIKISIIKCVFYLTFSLKRILSIHDTSPLSFMYKVKGF